MEISKKLQAYMADKPVSFAMPGHKMRSVGGIIDVTELDATVDLHHNSPEVWASSKRLADYYGADRSLYLVGGSTAGIFTMLYSVCRPGDTVAVGRACHKAVMNACIFLGLKVVLIPQKTYPGFLIPKPPEPEAVRRAIGKYPGIRAVLITSPDYYGVCADVRAIADTVHRYGIPLLVDEAHGAHFKASPRLPESAMELGADMAVQSAHKTLSALTPAAFLHIKKGIVDPGQAAQVAAMVQTSSPPYYVIASAEQSIAELLENKGAAWERVMDVIAQENEKLFQETRVQLLPDSGRDITRIVFGFSQYQTTGPQIGQVLKTRFGIDVEMTGAYNVVCIATAGNTVDEIRYLYRAVKAVCRDLKPRREEAVLAELPDTIAIAEPQKAFYGKKRLCPVLEAVGKTAASMIGAYPPGIPVVWIGETLTGQAAAYLRYAGEQGVSIQGAETFQVAAEH